MQTVVYVAIAGAIGALSRWGISKAAYQVFGESFPFGTFLVNLIGSFLIGLIMYISVHTDKISPSLRLALTIGFLGALTTFSTFSYETIKYMENGVWMTALLNIAANLILGLTATFLGLVTARLILSGG